MKFSFLKLNSSPCPAFPERSSTWRPIITAHLCSLNLVKRLQYYVLLDTGADYNLFHSDIAKIIGIDDYKSGREQRMFGIEGEGITSYFHDIVIEVGGWKYKAYSGFTDFEGRRKADKMPYGILGQEGFFDVFKAIFDYRKLEIELRPQKEAKFV